MIQGNTASVADMESRVLKLRARVVRDMAFMERELNAMAHGYSGDARAKNWRDRVVEEELAIVESLAKVQALLNDARTKIMMETH